MISSDRAMTIAFFLRNIIAKVIPVPYTVVSDFVWAILITDSNIFAKYNDLNDYLQKRYMTIVWEILA